MQSNHHAILNRPCGYEIAAVLVDETLTFSGIKEQVSDEYCDCHNQEITRILETGEKNNIFVIPPTRGAKKYTLNNDIFEESEIATIRKRAHARSHETGDHINSAYTQSMWLK